MEYKKLWELSKEEMERVVLSRSLTMGTLLKNEYKFYDSAFANRPISKGKIKYVVGKSIDSGRLYVRCLVGEEQKCFVHFHSHREIRDDLKELYPNHELINETVDCDECIGE